MNQLIEIEIKRQTKIKQYKTIKQLHTSVAIGEELK